MTQSPRRLLRKAQEENARHVRDRVHHRLYNELRCGAEQLFLRNRSDPGKFRLPDSAQPAKPPLVEPREGRRKQSRARFAGSVFTDVLPRRSETNFGVRTYSATAPTGDPSGGGCSFDVDRDWSPRPLQAKVGFPVSRSAVRQISRQRSGRLAGGPTRPVPKTAAEAPLRTRAPMLASDPVLLTHRGSARRRMVNEGNEISRVSASFSANTHRPSRARSRLPFLWMSPWITSRNSKTGHPSRIRLRPCAGTCPWREHSIA